MIYTVARIYEQGARYAAMPEGKADRKAEFAKSLALSLAYYTGKTAESDKREDYAKGWTQARVISHKIRQIKANPYLLVAGDFVAYRCEWKVDFQ
jgi:hypothetical protein